MAKCFRCLNGDYLKQLDEYAGLILSCLQCGHKINLGGSSLIKAKGRLVNSSRTPVYKKVKVS